MNILYCAAVMVYTMTPITELDVRRINLAISVCKHAKLSNGCLVKYMKINDRAQIMCGKR
jgi:hypothetical protein